jgi:hypothetical protein
MHKFTLGVLAVVASLWLLTAQTASPTARLTFQEEGVSQGRASVVNVTGSASTVSISGSTATLNIATSAAASVRTLGITIDGGGSAITTGIKGFVQVPFAGTITGVTLLSVDDAATSGSIVVDVWKDTYANYPPTVADTITAAAKPTLSSATKSVDTTLTGWTLSVSAGDIIAFKVDSATTVTKVLLILTVSI